MKQLEVSTGKVKFLLVEMPYMLHTKGTKISMGYLVLNVPDFENWVTDAELESPAKLNKYLARTEGKSDFKRSAIKLPDHLNIEDDSYLGIFDKEKQELDFEVWDSWPQIVIQEENNIGYRDYRIKPIRNCVGFKSPKDSLLSLFNIETSRAFPFKENPFGKEDGSGWFPNNGMYGTKEEYIEGWKRKETEVCPSTFAVILIKDSVASVG